MFCRGSKNDTRGFRYCFPFHVFPSSLSNQQTQPPHVNFPYFYVKFKLVSHWVISLFCQLWICSCENVYTPSVELHPSKWPWILHWLCSLWAFSAVVYGFFCIHSLWGLRMERVSLHLMQHVILFTTSSSVRNADNIFTRCVQGNGIEKC